MARDNLIIAPPDPHRDLDEMFDLIAKVFSHRGYFTFRDYTRDLYIGASQYDWSASRVGRLDGRIVCHVGVWDYLQHIGRARVRTGGVGAVATHADYRGRGLMARMFPATLGAMRKGGYGLSMLSGIHGFYDRFGYASAWPYVQYDVQAGDLPPGRGPGLKRFAPGPRADLDALYNRQHAGLTGTAVHPTYQKNRRGKALEGRLWQDSAGRPVGYVLLRRETGRLVCTQAAGPAEQTLAALADLVRRGKYDSLTIEHLHGRHPLARLLKRRTCKVTHEYCHTGRAMIRVVNLASALARIAPELARRLRASDRAHWQGEVLVTDADGRAVLDVDRGRVTVREAEGKRYAHAIRAPRGLGRLLVGSAEPEDVVRSEGIRPSGEARKLLRILFPAQEPQMWRWDWF